MSFLMDVPAQFAVKYGLGEIVRYGSILKDAKTGLIVAHLRETPALVNLISQMPVNPVNMLSGLVQASSSLVANYQLYNQSNQLADIALQVNSLQGQLSTLTGVVKSTVAIGSIGAVASMATFALCAMKFKAIEDRLKLVENQTTEILSKLKEIDSNNDKREVRAYLNKIITSFDYLLSPSISKTTIEIKQHGLTEGFNGLNNYVKYQIDKDSLSIDLSSIQFVYNVMLMAAMGEFRGFVILNDIEGANYLLKKRMSDFICLNKYLTNITQKLLLDKVLTNSELLEKEKQLKPFVTEIVDSCVEFDCQRLIVSEYLMKNRISIKRYYEEIDSNDSELIKIVKNPSELQRKIFKKVLHKFS